jgi:hypothetical protein
MSTETQRVSLKYDAGLTVPDSWRILDDRRGIAVRVRVGAVECSAEIDLRWRSPQSKEWPGAVYFQPYDPEMTTWLTAEADLGGGLLRLALSLEQCPEHVSTILRGW